MYSSELPGKGKISRTGEYDRELVCDECEARFDKWDDYAFKLFVETTPKVIEYDSGEPIASVFENIDNATLRLFFISLLWRMHETKRSAFSSVDIGPYAARARDAVLVGDGSLLPELDIVVTRFRRERSPGLLCPVRGRMGSVNVFWVVFHVYSIRIKVDQREFQVPFDELPLGNASHLFVLERDFGDSPEKRAFRAGLLGKDHPWVARSSVGQ